MERLPKVGQRFFRPTQPAPDTCAGVQRLDDVEAAIERRVQVCQGALWLAKLEQDNAAPGKRRGMARAQVKRGGVIVERRLASPRAVNRAGRGLRFAFPELPTRVACVGVVAQLD